MGQIFTRSFPQFDEMRNMVLFLSFEVAKHRKALEELESELSARFAEYQKERWQLIVNEIEKNGLVFCSHCCSFHRKKEGRLVCVVQNTYYEHGYENGCYGYRYSSEVYFACPKCYKKMKARSGWKGKYDTQAGGQESFDMYDVTVDDKGIFSCFDFNQGKPVALEEHLRSMLAKIPGNLLESLAYQLLLPKDIRLDNERKATLVDWPEE